jgi:hypothetical protein
MDLACNLVWILDCDFKVELLADSNLDKTIVGSRILLQIWADRRICIPLFTPPVRIIRQLQITGANITGANNGLSMHTFEIHLN